MAREYKITGNFQVVTTCADLDKLAQALNETARQFGDILNFNWDERGYMFIVSEMDLEIPVNEFIDGDEELEEAELEDDSDPN